MSVSDISQGVQAAGAVSPALMNGWTSKSPLSADLQGLELEWKTSLSVRAPGVHDAWELSLDSELTTEVTAPCIERNREDRLGDVEQR